MPCQLIKLILLLLMRITMIDVANATIACQMDTGREPWVAGNDYSVSCDCNGELNVTLWNGETQLGSGGGGHVSGRVINATAGWNEIKCVRSSELLMATENVVVRIEVDTEKVECRLVKTELSCAFERPDEENVWHDTSYRLRSNATASVPCQRENDTSPQMHCSGVVKPYFTEYSLSLETYDAEDRMLYAQNFTRKSAAIEVLQWSTLTKVDPQASQTCVFWRDSTTPSDKIIEWQVDLRLSNSQPYHESYTLDGQIQADRIYEQFCFPTPRWGHQSYDLTLRRRIKPNGPWSTPHPPINFTTLGIPPARPPQILPNGFAYSPRAQSLRIFWLRLNETESNGPNMTYLVTSEQG